MSNEKRNVGNWKIHLNRHLKRSGTTKATAVCSLLPIMILLRRGRSMWNKSIFNGELYIVVFYGSRQCHITSKQLIYYLLQWCYYKELILGPIKKTHSSLTLIWEGLPLQRNYTIYIILFRCVRKLCPMNAACCNNRDAKLAYSNSRTKERTGFLVWHAGELAWNTNHCSCSKNFFWCLCISHTSFSFQFLFFST
jgi:hypothetical protein